MRTRFSKKEPLRFFKHPFWTKVNEFIVKMILVFGIFGAAVVFTAMTVTDIEVKNRAMMLNTAGAEIVNDPVVYKCLMCGGITDTGEILLTHNCISTTTGKKELVHEQEVSIEVSDESIDRTTNSVSQEVVIVDFLCVATNSYECGKDDCPIHPPVEPNESETPYFLIAEPDWKCSGCGKTIPISEGHFCLMRYIPTWPDYIELEKDLRIDTPDTSEPNSPYTNAWEIQIPKGTKIYFK